MYIQVEDNVCAWSSSHAIASNEQVQTLSRHPHDTQALPVMAGSTEALTSGVLEEYDSTWPTTKSHGSSTWLDTLAGLWTLSTSSSVASSDAASTTSDKPAHSITVWSVCMLPHPRPKSAIERTQLFERILEVSGAGPIALYGIGGAGKTQLAVKLAYCFLQRNPEFFPVI